MKLLYKFLTIRLMSTLSDQILLFAVPLLVYQATQNISMSGLAFFIEWLPRVISLPFAGILSDIFGGRRVYIFADAARAFFCLVGFILLIMLPNNCIFYIVSIVMGLCAFCYAQAFIAQETTIPSLVGLENMHKAQSMVQSIEQTSVVVGPLIAAIFSYFMPIRDLFLVAAVIFTISFLGMYGLQGFSAAVKTESRRLQISDLWRGLMIVIMNKKLVWLSILTVSVNLLWGLSLATGAAMITGVYLQTSVQFGFVQTMVGVFSIVALIIATFLIHRLSLTLVGLITYCLIVIAGFIIGFSQHYYWYLIGYTLILILDGVFNIYIRTERVKIIPKEHLGKTIGVIVLINQLSVPVAGLVVSTYSKTIGIHNLYRIFACISAFLLIAQLLTLTLSYNSKKELPVEDSI